MITIQELKGKTRNEIISYCVNKGYKCDEQTPTFFYEICKDILKENPLFTSGIKQTDYIRYIKLTNDNDEILIVDIFNSSHSPISDKEIICSKLFSSEIKSGIFRIGYVGNI
jgi:hypothetical protein